MKKFLPWLGLVVLVETLSTGVVWAEKDHHSTADATTSIKGQYNADMVAMHENMMSAMKEKNADRMFARGMIAHHQGAIDMAKMELEHGKDPEMRKLAEEVIAAQLPEIEKMQSWLERNK